MEYSKLNVLHWRLADQESFPFVSSVFPKLSELGAYDANHTYPPEVRACVCVCHAVSIFPRMFRAYTNTIVACPKPGRNQPGVILPSCNVLDGVSEESLWVLLPTDKDG